ncbi:MAG: PepSY-associated TM helix domain-containing protein [Myxococcota bacterium]
MKTPQWWTKSLFDFHSSLGVGLGVLLFATVFSGTVAVLADEMMHWEYSAMRGCAPGDLPIQDAVDDADTRIDLTVPVVVHLPESDHGCLTVQWMNPDRWNGIEWVRYDPAEKQAAALDISGSTWMLVRMHTNFVAQNAMGRYASGFVGVFFMLSIIAGLLMHRRIREQAYSLNTGGSARKVAADLHKGVGVWAFPFHLLMGLTGAWVGLAGLVTAVMGFAALGSQEAVFEAVIGPQLEATGRQVEMVNLDDVVEQALDEVPGSDLHFLFLERWKDETARVHVHLGRDDRLGDDMARIYSGADGSFVQTLDFSEESPYQQLYAAVGPLHYATYGGTPLKLIYFVLGCVMCVLIASGLAVWIAHREQVSTEPSRWPPSLAVGGCAGIVVATAALLAARPFFPSGVDPFLFSVALYFSVWVAVIIVAVVRRTSLSGYVNRSAQLTAGLLVFAAAARPATQADVLRDPSALAIEAVLVISGLLLFLWARHRQGRAPSRVEVRGRTARPAL